MQKKIIDLNGFRLAYIEKKPQASNTIFFIHGNSGSSTTWTNQLNSPLFQNYRLIAIDLPAHGDSDASNNPEEDYSPIGTAQILAQAIKRLMGTSPFLLAGFSYGTNLIAEMLLHDLNPQGIAFTGACVVGENHGPEKVLADPESNIFLHEDISVQKAGVFFEKHLFTSNRMDSQFYLNDFFGVKPLFRSFLMQSVVNRKYTDEILTLQKLNVPLLIVFGQNDNLIYVNYLDDAPLPLWKNTIVKLPGSGHFVQTDKPEIFNQLLFEYSKDRFNIDLV